MLNRSNSTGLKRHYKEHMYGKDYYIMNKNELLEYIDTNSTAITIFKDKVRAEQEAKIELLPLRKLSS